MYYLISVGLITLVLQWVFSVFLPCCPVVSLALRSYSLRPDYMLSKWIKKDVSRCILVLDTSLFIHFDDKYFRTEGVENRVGDDGVPAILQYRPSDLYLVDSKETMMVEVGNNHDCRFLWK